MNTLQKQIIDLINSAQSNIRIAVSWFTDENILECLITKTNNCNVSILLSSDELNLLRHSQFRRLITNGANIRKIGANSAIDGNFMHNKYIVVDNKDAYGGSYNFTQNARSNYESFKKWDISEVRTTINEFDSLMRRATGFLHGVSNADEIVQKLKKKFAEEQKKHNNTIRRFSEIDFVESCIQKEEASSHKANTLRSTAGSLTNQLSAVTSSATISNNSHPARKKTSTNARISSTNSTTKRNDSFSGGAAVVGGSGYAVKKHKFHGGSAFLSFPQKSSNSYSLAYYQKYQIDKRYNCFKTRIVNDVLICSGEIQPTKDCESYKIRVEYVASMPPRVYVNSPKLEDSNMIHIYREGCLCLYDPKETKWKDTMKISEYTIPWTVEWILYYELWKLSGKWEGPESVH